MASTHSGKGNVLHTNYGVALVLSYRFSDTGTYSPTTEMQVAQLIVPP